MKWIYTNCRAVRFIVPPEMMRGAEPFKAEWLRIDPASHSIDVPAGYSWDGCSPKLFSVLGLFWVGTPDGIHRPDGFTITGRASMVHDALYQYIGQHNLTRAQCDAIFAHQLRQDGFLLWPAYYAAVRVFGGLYHAAASFLSSEK